MQWYYSKNNTQLGPISEQELRVKLSCGEVSINDRVWKDGMRDWLKASETPEFAGISATQSPLNTATYPYLPPAYPSGVPMQTSGLAIASIICGIMGLITCLLIPGIPAVICGHMALRSIDNFPASINGRGLAITGLVTGYISLAIGFLFVAFYALLFFGIAFGASSNWFTEP